MSDTTTHTHVVVPPVKELSAAQRRGALCVWCASGLPAGTAHSLGELPTPEGGLMYPRCCERCWRTH